MVKFTALLHHIRKVQFIYMNMETGYPACCLSLFSLVLSSKCMDDSSN